MKRAVFISFIKLSRTVRIASKNISRPEKGAIVTVEGDQNTVYPLAGSANGNYVSAGLNLDNMHKYRLHIKTSDGKEYLSDFVQVVNSYPIDSVNYVIGPDGFNGYVNTHDPKNNTRYYRWTYHSQLPDSWLAKYPYEGCHLDSELLCAPPFCTNQVALYLIPLPSIKIPVGPLLKDGLGIGDYGSTKECVDCTLRGTKKAPAFWKY
jgi:hypothetical protein